VELFSPGHLIPLLIIAALVFFGWKQLPDMARSAGRSLRVFRTEVKGMADDDAARATQSALSSATAPTTANPAAAAAPMPGVPGVANVNDAPAVEVVAHATPPVVAPVITAQVEAVAPDEVGKPVS
jgi:sec-independent protein translocase protein TatA